MLIVVCFKILTFLYILMFVYLWVSGTKIIQDWNRLGRIKENLLNIFSRLAGSEFQNLTWDFNILPDIAFTIFAVLFR